MGRTEKFKSIRLYKRKCRSVIFLFLFLTIVGVFIVDYSISEVITYNSGSKLISVNILDSQLELGLMNMKFYIGTELLTKFFSSFVN